MEECDTVYRDLSETSEMVYLPVLENFYSFNEYKEFNNHSEDNNDNYSYICRSNSNINNNNNNDNISKNNSNNSHTSSNIESVDYCKLCEGLQFITKKMEVQFPATENGKLQKQIFFGCGRYIPWKKRFGNLEITIEKQQLLPASEEDVKQLEMKPECTQQ